MRLLKREKTGWFSSTYDFSLAEYADQNIPKYAILSHRWGPEEVIFKDLESGKAKTKAGYKKLQFCGEQAARDGLLYSWIDTCCINKENKAEVAKAINSMFRWYRNATRYYVYLSDVSCPPDNKDECNPPQRELDVQTSKWFIWNWMFLVLAIVIRWYDNATQRHTFLLHGSRYSFNSKQKSDPAGPPQWESAFRDSRWFTRGWTLQELLAPAFVEFFSQEGMKLGDKRLLMEQIYDITNIPHSVLQGNLCLDSASKNV